MHVEIDDGDTAGAVMLLGVTGGDRRVVEEAKAHRRRGLGMVAGRAHGDESVLRLAGHHRVHGGDGAAGRAQDRLPASGRECGVGVDAGEALGGHRRAQRLDVFRRMHAGDRGDVGLRRRLALERGEFRLGECLLQRADAVGPLRVAGGSLVGERGRVSEQDGHAITGGAPRKG